MSTIPLRLLLLPAVLAAACGMGAPAALAAPAFPRIAAYWIEAFVSPEDEAVLAKSSLAVVEAEVAENQPAVLPRLSAANPSLELLAYLTSEEVPHRADPDEQPAAARRFASITPAEWLLEPGSRLLRPIDADDTLLAVADASGFSPTRPASDFHPADEPTFLLVGGEHMRLLDVDGNRLRVERGYRSRPTAHAAGAAVAEHVVFFAGTWMLDLADTAPPATAHWRDRLVDEAAALVERGPFHGVFLDVCFEDVSFLNDGVLDVDRDGRADDPAAASRAWTRGFGDVVKKLRARLGPTVPIVANPGAQDCPHPELDGILLEGWPTGMPDGFLGMDEGMRRYLAWSRRRGGRTIANGFSPRLGFGVLREQALALGRTDWAAMRFGLAMALMGDGFFTFDNGVFGHYSAWWYDEYDGAGRGRGWLGRAQGPGEELPSGAWMRSFEHGLAVANPTDSPIAVSLPDGHRTLRGRQDPRHNDGRAVRRLVVPPRDAFVLVRDGTPPG